jgi:hypothetical protein
MPLAAALDPTWATLILATLVLIAGTFLAREAMRAPDETQKNVFAIVGVLFGLLAAGGLGGIFVKQAADSSAQQAAQDSAAQVQEAAAGQVEAAAKQSAAQAASRVQQDVMDQVQQALEATPPSE